MSEPTNRFLVIGLGSMGRRRVRDLVALNAGTVIGYDPRGDRRAQAEEEHGIRTFDTFAAADAANPTAIVVSTPPELHVEYALKAARAGKHLFVEASVLDEGLRELADLCARQPIVAAPSATLRFHPLAVRIKELLDSGTIGRPLSFVYHFGQFLPDWHPWEDYRTFYASQRRTAGSREMIAFVSVLLTWLFGDVRSVSAIKTRSGALPIDIDDVYHVNLLFESGVAGSLASEVVSHVPYRTLRLATERGVVEWDWNAGQLRVFTRDDGKWEIIPEGRGFRGFSSEQIYVSEIERFVNAIDGSATWDYSLSDDLRVLEVLNAVERSCEEERHVRLAPARVER